MVNNKIDNAQVTKRSGNNFKEPERCEQIPFMNDELEKFKNQKQSLKPVDNYLTYCENYATKHFIQDKIKFENYKLKKEDFLNLHDPDSKQLDKDKMYMLNKATRPEMDSIEPRLEDFDTNIKQSFCEFMPVRKNGCDVVHYLIVKTWEQVTQRDRGVKQQSMTYRNTIMGASSLRSSQLFNQKFNSPSKHLRTQNESRSTLKINPNGNKSSFTAKASDQQTQRSLKQVDTKTFFIKTIRIYDEQTKLLEEFLVEQVQMKDMKAQVKEHDIGMIKNGNAFYYFKRIFIQSQDIEKSKLQLFKYTFSTIDEEEKEIMLGEKYIIDEVEQKVDLVNGKIQDEPLYNVIFSRQFGGEKDDSGFQVSPGDQNEEQFLSKQYIMLNKYKSNKTASNCCDNQDQTIKSIDKQSDNQGEQNQKKDNHIYEELPQIRKLDTPNIKKPFPGEDTEAYENSFDYQIEGLLMKLSERQQKDDEKSSHQQAKFKMAKMILHMPDKQKIDEKKDVQCIKFFISDLYTIIKITVMENEYYQSTKQDYDKQKRLLTKVNCNEKIRLSGQAIQVQNILLNVNNEEKLKHNREKINQYFFIDQQNNIQLLSPQHDQKVEQQQIIKFIQDQSQIQAKFEFCNYKRIQVDQECINSHECHFRNYFQPIEHLNMIIKDKQISQEHILTYVKNPITETLIIVDPRTPNQIKYIQYNQFKTQDDGHTFTNASNQRQRFGEEENHEVIANMLKNPLLFESQQQILYSLSTAKRQRNWSNENHFNQQDESKLMLLNFNDSLIEVQSYDREILESDKNIHLVMYQR